MRSLRIEIRWGLLFSLILMIWMFIEKNIGWHDKYIGHQAGYHIIALAVIYILAYSRALMEKRDRYYNGFMSWKQGLISGVVISVIVAVLSPLTQFFIYHYISPDYFKNMIDYQVNQGSMSEKNARTLYSMKFFIIQEIGIGLSLGIVISAIVALFIRTKKTKKQ